MNGVCQTFILTSFTRLVHVRSQSCSYPSEKWHNGKSDENLLGVSLQTSPPPNKWIKRKAALLSPLPLSVWWTLVSDEPLSWPYSVTCHVITQVPSPGLPQEESVPRALHAKCLDCLTVREKRSVVKKGLWVFTHSVQCFCHYEGLIRLRERQIRLILIVIVCNSVSWPWKSSTKNSAAVNPCKSVYYSQKFQLNRPSYLIMSHFVTTLQKAAALNIQCAWCPRNNLCLSHNINS